MATLRQYELLASAIDASLSFDKDRLFSIQNELPGLGSFRQLLLDPEDDTQWTVQSDLQYRDSVKKIYDLIKESQLEERQKESIINGLKGAQLSSYFTPGDFIDAVIDPLTSKINPSSILEPSAGSGRMVRKLISSFPDASI
ncbi:MAG: hypothetical protein RJQ14_26535, partial [Marinoscillum sp.]